MPPVAVPQPNPGVFFRIKPVARAGAAALAVAMLLLVGLAAVSGTASAQGRDGLHARAVAAVQAAEGVDFASVTALRRTMVDVAAALKALRYSEAEAREGGKAEPPAFAGLRPGQVAGPDVAVRRPGEQRVPLADVPDAWFAFHLDRAEGALVELLTKLDQGQGAGGEGRRLLSVIDLHLDAMLRPPPGL